MNKSFNQKCYQLLKLIPWGKVTTYKEIANTLNSKAFKDFIYKFSSLEKTNV